MKVRFLTIIFLLLVNLSCEDMFDHVYLIRINNNSNYTILYFNTYNYPDTSLPVKKPVMSSIDPKDYDYLDSKKKWEEVLAPPHDTISIFILSKDTVDAYTWMDIRNSYNILKRYDLSLADLERNGWEISYP